MPDYREHLYNYYVTAFKKGQLHQSEATLQAYWAWAKYKLLPLFAQLKPNDPILDLGCGPGYFVEFLKNHGFGNVTGIDISEEQVQLARARGINIQVANVFDFLKGKETVYKAVVALDFVEHFTKDELMQLLPLISGTLQKNGRFILETPNAQGLFPNETIYGDLTHSTVFTLTSLQQILSITGFEQIKFYETGPVPKDTKGRTRLLMWKMIKFIANTIRLIETGNKQQIWTENLICCCYKSQA